MVVVILAVRWSLTSRITSPPMCFGVRPVTEEASVQNEKQYFDDWEISECHVWVIDHVSGIKCPLEIHCISFSTPSTEPSEIVIHQLKGGWWYSRKKYQTETEINKFINEIHSAMNRLNWYGDDMNVQVNAFDSAMQKLGFAPKGVKVGVELYKELVKLGRVKQKFAFLEGIIDIGLELPFLDEEIHIYVDPLIDDWDFKMPTKA